MIIKELPNGTFQLENGTILTPGEWKKFRRLVDEPTVVLVDPVLQLARTDAGQVRDEHTLSVTLDLNK